jgi:two-component system LytT family response regulator
VVTIDKDSVSIRRQNQLKEIPIGEAYRKPFYQLIDRKIIKRDYK